MKGQGSILSRNDLSILTAKTAEEMLGIHEKEGVDLILVELDIDEMGGDGLCTSIRNNSSLRQHQRHSSVRSGAEQTLSFPNLLMRT